MSTWLKFSLLLLILFALRLTFGLFVSPIQPMEDEIQTYLLGLKYYATGAWPYYGNDVVAPLSAAFITQDPGALQTLLIGLPLRIWPSPLSPFLLLNLISLSGLSFLAWYGSKRLPRLSPWFLFPWVLTSPWCLHYSTDMLNLSYSLAGASVFFVALMESVPALSLGWIKLPLANVLMGFSLLWNVQLHRTWVLLPPFALASFFSQWKASRKITGPFFFLLGAFPLFLLMVPTFLQGSYHFHGQVSGLSFGLNVQNFLGFFILLARFLSFASFEMPRFLGMHTPERIGFLTHHPWLLLPGVFLWFFGILQTIILLGYGFNSRDPQPGWKPIRLLAGSTFLLVYGALLFTAKEPYVNTYYETLPVAMIYSFYVWDRWWTYPLGRRFLWVFLAAGLYFQAGYVWVQVSQKQSFYLKYQDTIAQAIQSRDYGLLGQRRSGSYY